MEGLIAPQITVDVKEIEVFKSGTSDLTEQARRIAALVHSKETADTAVEWCQGQLGVIDAIEKKLGPIREMWNRGHKATTGLIAELCNPRKAAVAVVKEGIRSWKWKEDEARRKEEARLAEEARKREEEDRLAAAEVLEKQGNSTLADAILEGPSLAAPPVVPEVKAKAMSQRKRWGVRVVDKRAFIKFVAERPEADGALIVNESWLKAQAKQMDGNMKYPGVEVYPDDDISIRRAS